MWCGRGGVGLILEVGKRLKRKDDHDRSRVAATVQKRALDAVAGANRCFEPNASVKRRDDVWARREAVVPTWSKEQSPSPET